MKRVDFKNFNSQEEETWKILFKRQQEKRSQQIVEKFSRGLELLKITADKIPDLDAVNERLLALTGWQGVAVEGLEEGFSFYEMLAQKQFPIGNFIREQKDLSYTPAPDIFHDLYGHIPFYTDQAYADFCAEFAKKAIGQMHKPGRLREFERIFWFTVEFGLIKTASGRQIFGAGIASSFGECAYALSDQPEVVPFNLEEVREQEFRIDVFQERLFLLESETQLYQCLELL